MAFQNPYWKSIFQYFNYDILSRYVGGAESELYKNTLIQIWKHGFGILARALKFNVQTQVAHSMYFVGKPIGKSFVEAAASLHKSYFSRNFTSIRC